MDFDREEVVFAIEGFAHRALADCCEGLGDGVGYASENLDRGTCVSGFVTMTEKYSVVDVAKGYLRRW